MKLQERVAIVTGAAGGLGQAFCLALAKEGAKIVAADLKPAEETLTRIRQSGGEAIVTTTDVTSAESAAAMAQQAIETFGRIDILINNAGILAGMKPFDEISDEEWDLVMNVNLKGQWQCCKAVIPTMKVQNKGKIINIGSTTFYEGVPNTVHYVASKGGVIGFSRSLARELTNTGINVNVIAPGLTLTPTTKDQLNSTALEEVRKHVNAARIVQRDQYPEDLTGAVVFLSSDDSNFISGQTLSVDGGTTLN